MSDSSLPLLKIKYFVGNAIEDNVSIERVTVVPYDNNTNHINRSGTTRSNTESANQPNISLNISTSNQGQQQDFEQLDAPDLSDLKSVLSQSFTSHGYSNQYPLYLYLKSGMEEQKGWICNVINQSTMSVRKQLNKTENLILVVISSLGHTTNKGGLLQSHEKIVQHAFGIGKSTRKFILKYFALFLIPFSMFILYLGTTTSYFPSDVLALIVCPTSKLLKILLCFFSFLILISLRSLKLSSNLPLSLYVETILILCSL